MKWNLNWMVGCQKTADDFPKKWIPATVPGAIQLDFAAAEKYAPYTYGEETMQFRWMEDSFFRYRATLPKDIVPGDEVVLVIRGIDYQYAVYLDNTLVLEHTGMFSPIELNLTRHIRTVGSNLDIVIYPVPKVPGKADCREQAAHCCKPAVSYGWDFHPRLIPCGIWKEIWIERRDAPTITDTALYTTLSDDRCIGTLKGEVIVDKAEGCELECGLYDEEGNLASLVSIPVTDSTISLCQTVNNPHLWWPNGHGLPTRYTVRLRLLRDDQEQAVHEQKCGFRRVELVLDPDAHESPYPASQIHVPITVCINGKRLFAKGSNWVCPTVFPGTLHRETYQAQLELVRDANMNMVRCWGGAIVNKDDFFDLCDEYGLMLWQEFPLACNKYPDDPTYLAVLEQESVAIIKQVRSHPCLTIWCGGNELYNSWSRMTNQSKALRLLNRNCFNLDPDTPFLPTAPLMGMGHGGYYFWDLDGDDIFIVINRSNRNAYSEFGCPSGTTWDRLQALLPADQLDTPGQGSSWVSHFATGAWLPDSFLHVREIQNHFPDAKSTQQILEISRQLQAIGYQYFFEEAQRQWPVCSMALNWCWNEPFPCAANNSIIGYDMDVKPAYQAVCQAMRKTFLSARIPRFDHSVSSEIAIELWLMTEEETCIKDEIILSIERNGQIISAKTVFPDCTVTNTHQLITSETLVVPETAGWFTLKLQISSHPEWNSFYTLLAK